jgi:hypothetical protein
MNTLNELSEITARLTQLEKAVTKRKGATNMKGAADYLGMSEETLRRIHADGGGPRRSRNGRYYIYTYENLDRYLQELQE